MGELTLSQKIKKFLKDEIVDITWKIFLWSIGMKAEQYWKAIYREERNRRCIDYRDENLVVYLYCNSCKKRWRDNVRDGNCPECGSGDIKKEVV